MSAQPLISIVVPSFNQGRYIGETLSSLVEQNYPSLEIIVVDGGSTDQTVDVIRSFAPYIKFWVSERDGGQSNAINKGLAHVSGEIFNWLNSDDILEPGALHELAKLSVAHPEKTLFIGKTRFFDANGTIRNSTSIVFNRPEITLGYGQVNQPAMFYRVTALRDLLPVDESLHFCMDLDLWMRYLINHGQDHLIETDYCFAGFRFHDESKTLSTENPFRSERDTLYATMFSRSKGNALITNAEPYYHLWKADELMLQKNFEASSESLEKVSFLKLSFSGKRRYIGIKRKLTLRNKVS